MAIAFALAACISASDTPDAAPEPTITDSAGVRIVEYPASALEIPPVTLSAPETIIGAADGDGADVFGRIWQVARLTDGAIVVFDVQPHEVKIFEADGSFRMRFGREGQGPGEFDPGTASGMYPLPGDTLAVVDQLGQRVQLFTSRGEFVEARRKAPDADYWAYNDVFRDGSWLVRLASWRPDADPILGRQEIHQFAARAPGDLSRVDTLTHFLNYVGYLSEVPGNMIVNLAIPFSPAGGIAPLGDAVVAHDGADYELRWVSFDGQISQFVRISADRREVSSADLAAERERRLEVYDESRRRVMERIFLDMPRESHFPAFGPGMVSDRSSRLWIRTDVRPSARSGDAGTQHAWLVIDDDGRLLGRVVLPDAEVPRYVDATHLITLGRDEMDVESTRVYRLPPSLVEGH